MIYRRGGSIGEERSIDEEFAQPEDSGLVGIVFAAVGFDQLEFVNFPQDFNSSVLPVGLIGEEVAQPVDSGLVGIVIVAVGFGLVGNVIVAVGFDELEFVNFFQDFNSVLPALC